MVNERRVLSVLSPVPAARPHPRDSHAARLRGLALLSLLAAIPARAAAPADILSERFAEGEPLRGEPWTGADACAACHAEETASWADSAHARAWTSEVFQAGFLLEPEPWCVGCHAPSPAQRTEVAHNAAARARLAPDAPVPARRVRLAPEGRADEGITCAVCHVRDGVIVASEVSGRAAHLTLAVPGFGSESCRSCHEFGSPVFSGDTVTITDLPMQSTWSEWRAWGGPEDCVDCHMPEGDHACPGASDRALLARSVAVEVVADGDGHTWTFTSVDVGHHLPTGDLFRHLTLEVAGEDGTWRTIASFGRTFEDGLDLAGHTRRLVSDTSLRPGEPRRIHAAAGIDRWRLVYHYASALDESRGLLPPSTLLAVLAAGELPE